MTGRKSTGEGGYAALLAVIIIAVAGLFIVSSITGIAYNANQGSSALYRSEQAKGLANACAELALQKLLTSGIFVGTANVPLGAGSCTYTVTQLNSLMSVIQSTGTVGATVRKVKVTLAISSVVPVLQITSWQEVADF